MPPIRSDNKRDTSFNTAFFFTFNLTSIIGTALYRYVEVTKRFAGRIYSLLLAIILYQTPSLFIQFTCAYPY
ncbi:hypothetical protein FB446DRAFT_723530 [Lentinula raphanica]|nr:hypothetical protein FB446DRAFT_723530 [Lentinula raphanica]